MTQPTTLQFLIAALILTFTGVLLLRKGLKGRLVAHSQPHCRNCKLNLSDIDCESPTPCPNCGTLLRTNTPAITQGKRTPRKIVITSGILLLLLAIPCFSWPKIRTIPAVQNFELHSKLSDSILLSLLRNGDENALQELHNRLIPGTISDSALESLIVRAFEIQSNENQAWDTRYGDVLLYALVQDKLTQDQIKAYIEPSIRAHIAAHDLIGPGVETVYFESGIFRTGIFEPDPVFLHKLERESTVVWSPLRLKTFQFAATRNEEPVNTKENKGFGGESGVSFNEGVGSTWRLSEAFLVDEAKLKINLATEFVLVAGEHELHRWIEERSHTFTRADSPIKYASAITDHDALHDVVQSIQVSNLSVPINLAEAEKHQKTRHFGYSKFTISSDSGSEAALIGRISFRVGEFEIQFPDKTLTYVPRPSDIQTLFGVHSSIGNLDFYKQNRLFWMQAIMQGTVDVVIYPDIEAYSKNPNIKEFIASPVIFRDVPITRYQPEYSWIGDQQGNRWQEWRWTRIGEWSKSVPIQGEILEDE